MMNDQALPSPWPETEQNILFILDAGHKIESELLTEWVENTKTNTETSGNSHNPTINNYSLVVLPLSAAGEETPWEPLSAALKAAENMLIVPLRIAWTNSERFSNTRPRLRDLVFGDPRRPGSLRAKYLQTRKPHRIQYITGVPATLSELKERYRIKRVDEMVTGQLAGFVARQASLTLDIAERRFQGGRYKVPRFVASTLLARPSFNAALSELAKETNQSIVDLRAESRTYMKELIAIQKSFWVDVMGWINHRVLHLGYEAKINCDEEEIKRIKKIVRENPSAILWTHKSHTDGFVINSIMYDNDFPAPHIMGGINMAFAGLGYMGKRAGAIFIRRSFQDNPLYKLVLRQYISYLLEKRFPLTWSFEGTRSRVGKLMPPRYGIMKYVIEAAESSNTQNLHIIPVSISYDLIGDVADYASEQAGKEKRPESLSWFLGYLQALRKPMGEIHVNFGEPVIINPPSEASSESTSLTDKKLSIAKVAFDVGVQANNVTPVTPLSLLCMTLLGSAPQAFTANELINHLNELVNWIKARNIKLSSEFDANIRDHFEKITDAVVNNGLVTRYVEGPEPVYGIAPDQHGAASYYRNTIIHFFINKAITELALNHAISTISSNRVESFWQEIDNLRDLFKFEFFYTPGDAFRDQIVYEMNAINQDWEILLNEDGINMHSLLDQCKPLIAHATVVTFVEAYLVVADVLASMSINDVVEDKNIVPLALKYGRQAYLQRRISSEASIGKQLFQNGLKLMKNRGLTQHGNDEILEARKTFALSLRDLLRRLERIRSKAMSDQP